MTAKSAHRACTAACAPACIAGDDPTHGSAARIPGLHRGTTVTHSFRAAVAALRLDPGQLPIRDRAVLRILNHARLANAEQLGVLVYRNHHYAQIRLRRLWDLGYLERSGLPPPGARTAAAQSTERFPVLGRFPCGSDLRSLATLPTMTSMFCGSTTMGSPTTKGSWTECCWRGLMPSAITASPESRSRNSAGTRTRPTVGWRTSGRRSTLATPWAAGPDRLETTSITIPCDTRTLQAGKPRTSPSSRPATLGQVRRTAAQLPRLTISTSTRGKGGTRS